jgi:hypothetical protein
MYDGAGFARCAGFCFGTHKSHMAESTVSLVRQRLTWRRCNLAVYYDAGFLFSTLQDSSWPNIVAASKSLCMRGFGSLRCGTFPPSSRTRAGVSVEACVMFACSSIADSWSPNLALCSCAVGSHNGNNPQSSCALLSAQMLQHPLTCTPYAKELSQPSLHRTRSLRAGSHKLYCSHLLVCLSPGAARLKLHVSDCTQSMRMRRALV